MLEGVGAYPSLQTWALDTTSDPPDLVHPITKSKYLCPSRLLHLVLLERVLAHQDSRPPP